MLTSMLTLAGLKHIWVSWLVDEMAVQSRFEALLTEYIELTGAQTVFELQKRQVSANKPNIVLVHSNRVGILFHILMPQQP